MAHINKPALRLALLPLLLTMLPLPSAAARMFGKNAPFNTSDLPANSRLRKQLEWLPENTRQQALKRLNKFSFPESDAQHLNVTPEGHVFYSDPAPALQMPSVPLVMKAAPQPLLTLPEIDVFNLHSRPGSKKNQVFLDFDGMIITGTEWNKQVNRATLKASPFDLDGTPTDFNSEERAAIVEIWHRIAEDYAPFDIDVTTEEPVPFDRTKGHILFTKDTDANGYSMPAKGSGGVAFQDVWDQFDYVSGYSLAFVYHNNLGNSEPNSMAEAGAHEFGHNFGLSHDGTNSSGYFEGFGSGFVSWAPIMGISYYDHVTQWSKGEYPNANNKEDDVAIIGGQLGFRPDDHGNVFANANQLILDNDGKITVSTPQTDPDNTEPENKGIIESRTDVDMFFFDTGAGTINLLVEPAWTAFYRNDNRGANLDIKATLYDGNGSVVISDDYNQDTDAIIAATLAGGRYYLAIEGVGNNITPYSDYDSMGEYFISGIITNPDNQAPSPNPMTWANPPTILTINSITMTATTAIDNVSAVQYQFLCIAGGTGCRNSSWQTNPNFVAKNIGKGTYRYKVIARDVAGNVTAPSEEVAVAPSVPLVIDDTASVNEDGFVIVKVLENDSDISPEKLTISRFSQGVNGKVIRRLGGLQYRPVKNFNGTDSFTYTVANKRGGIATATVTITVTPVNDVPKAINDSIGNINIVTIGGLLEILPLNNDSDIDGDSLSITSISTGKKGTVTNNGSSIIYQAGASTGIDRLTYTISDGIGGTAKAVIGIRIKKP